ncbi:SigB/SigF/SigG family RNA polymerase sigma factor [Streptomyces fuscigenes]|uniref:SigB/SigF/SigG family RNA polymerase sigma factor n=1 Tax=Streptomyces fuscigenes TaxID=1528880 RepID=UPI001F2A58E7|nr:SigB/SigF/SigG family RNA polymerase sigma factor [Streptomyces fuscigenes]MCF3960228.1 SigB/SigF/SigG family RNA polymerase sigma factor [Streptomyces fuscigenes]
MRVPPQDARELTPIFFERLAVLEEGTPEYQYTRNTLIEMNDSLVKFVAGRFRNRGSGEMEDIVQVGQVGLIKAIDRFDLSRGIDFSSLAVPYIAGEIKRYFRDSTWAVHVPRSLQQFRIDLAKAADELMERFGRRPTVQEFAEHLYLSTKEVTEGLKAANGYVAQSLDAPLEKDSGTGPVRKHARAFGESIGRRESAMELVEDLHVLAPLLGRLDARQRRMVQLRFGDEMTQSEIGAQLGISQMHVSRLLRDILDGLRAGMLTDY